MRETSTVIPSMTHDTTEPGARWRVILVGRTGLDQTLRRRDDIELIRARDTLDAIGELADPIDEHSPDRAAVLVSPDADPEDHEHAHFVDSLRLVDDSVRVIRVGEPHALYDAHVHPHDDADTILRALDGATPTPRIIVRPQSVKPAPKPVVHEPAHAPVPDPRPIETAQREHDDEIHRHVLASAGASVIPAPAPSMSDAAPLDTRVIDALTAGKPILEDALAIIRARTDRDDIRFESSPSTPPVGSAHVVSRGHVYGALTCDDTEWATTRGKRLLESSAAWLGAWLRLESQQRELRASAFTDELTGAWNRRYFHRFLSAAIERSRDARRTVTLLYFDIDDFKGYNDRHGHAAGDEILVETVKLLSAAIRPSDKVCRIGGDEFVVIFYEPQGPRDPGSTPPESIMSIATRFQQQVCNHNFPKLGAQAQGNLTISGGLASYPWDGADADTLLNVADELALQSKRQGKNVITLGPGAESVCGCK